VRQDVDAAVGPDVGVVVAGAQVLPDHLGVAVQLDHAVAVRGIANALVDHEQVAVRIDQGFAEIDVRIGLRAPHRGVRVPHGAERATPFVQHRAIHIDEIGGGLVPGGVEGHAVLRARAVVDRDAAVRKARRVPQIGRVHIVVGGQLLVHRLAAQVRAGDVRPRE
jgi:hypothetical protein